MFVWILLAVMAWAESPGLVMVDRLAKQGMIVSALDKVNGLIQSNPEDVDLYAMRGSLFMLRGRYALAVDDFIYGLSSRKMYGTGGELYAKGLGILGECEKSSDEYQKIRLFGNLKEPAKVRLYAEHIDLLRSCGDADSAEELWYEMASQFPNAALTYFAQADALLDLGDIDGAYSALWQSSQHTKHVSIRNIYARIALLEGRYEQAFSIMEAIRYQRVADRAMLLYVLSALLSGQPSEILYKLDENRWEYNDNPMLLYARLVAYSQIEETNTQAYQWEREYFLTLCDNVCQTRILYNYQLETGIPWVSVL